MSWYAAHVVMYARWKKGRQERFPVWENIVLVQADSEEEAFAKAESRGREEEGNDDGNFRWGGRPATWVFAGVRKLTLCEDADEQPIDGTEVSYIEMEVDSPAAIRKLVAGQPVGVRLRERFRSSPLANGKGNSDGNARLGKGAPSRRKKVKKHGSV